MSNGKTAVMSDKDTKKEIRIRAAKNIHDMIHIAQKVGKIKEEKFDPHKLLSYLMQNLNKGFVRGLVVENKNKMVGCAVISTVNTWSTEAVFIEFMWADPHQPTVVKELMVKIEEVAKEIKIGKIMTMVRRGFQVYEEKYHGKETARIYEKEVK